MTRATDLYLNSNGWSNADIVKTQSKLTKARLVETRWGKPNVDQRHQRVVPLISHRLPCAPRDNCSNTSSNSGQRSEYGLRRSTIGLDTGRFIGFPDLGEITDYKGDIQRKKGHYPLE